jgi:exonuclease III
MKSCVIDTAPRGLDKASDHTPVIVEIGPELVYGTAN